MRTTLKIGLALVVSLALFSIFVFAQPPSYAPVDFAPSEEDRDFLARDMDEHHPLERDAIRLQREGHTRDRFLMALLSGHGEPAVVDGVFQGFAKNLMILDLGDGIVSVVLPPAWVVDGHIVRIPGLLEWGFLNEGDTVQVQALRMNRGGGAEAGYTVYVLFGYAIYNMNTEKTMYAVLPFNIEVAG